ncbi:MAG: zinc ribbon domain-containing protein [Chloroflexota bacterium]
MEVSRHWRLQSQRYNLVGETCPKCGGKLFPPRDVCLECESPAHELFTFSGRGEVYSYTAECQALELTPSRRVPR